MCGIAGFSISHDVHLPTSTLVRLFIAGLAERGEDACGFSWRGTGGSVATVKRPVPPLEFLRTVPIHLPTDARSCLIHVRDHTKGRPSHEGNNHPIRHGAISGVHNGIIQNDDELFAAHGRNRAVPGMSVDSEAIFMLLDELGTPEAAFSELVGSYSTAWFDDRDRTGLHLVRGRGRPLFRASFPGVELFASTRNALAFVRGQLGFEYDIESMPCGRLLRFQDGRVTDERRIRVRRFREDRTAVYDADQPAARQARELVGGTDLDEARTA